jgi:hypothetical protein
MVFVIISLCLLYALLGAVFVAYCDAYNVINLYEKCYDVKWGHYTSDTDRDAILTTIVWAWWPSALLGLLAFNIYSRAYKAFRRLKTNQDERRLKRAHELDSLIDKDAERKD